MADLTFSTTLLGQFLEDMEAYAEVKLVQSLKACCQGHTELLFSHALIPVRLIKYHEALFTGVSKVYFISQGGTTNCIFILRRTKEIRSFYYFQRGASPDLSLRL